MEMGLGTRAARGECVYTFMDQLPVWEVGVPPALQPQTCSHLSDVSRALT